MSGRRGTCWHQTLHSNRNLYRPPRRSVCRCRSAPVCQHHPTPWIGPAQIIVPPQRARTGYTQRRVTGCGSNYPLPNDGSWLIGRNYAGGMVPGGNVIDSLCIPRSQNPPDGIYPKALYNRRWRVYWRRINTGGIGYIICGLLLMLMPQKAYKTAISPI